ncbi:hypothetical protein [Mycoplasma ovis]|uniref:hypothetical protein n=1 Tax=Mycoplasma ovis TaxID=171632 RepID=UPI0011826E4B|nr:hypothetical protein [Mycoplasma ovis]
MVEFNAKSQTQLENGKTMISLGPEGENSNNIGDLRITGEEWGQPLVGVLMGLAINVAQTRVKNAEQKSKVYGEVGEECWNTWGDEWSKKEKLKECEKMKKQEKRMTEVKFEEVLWMLAGHALRKLKKS